MLANKVVVFSGFRDDIIADRIANAGGIVKTSLVKATNLVVYKKNGKAGTKIEEAQNRGIEVMELEQFKRTFLPSRLLESPPPLPSPKALSPKAPSPKAPVKKVKVKANALDKCNYIELPQYEKDYERNNYNPTLTVKQVENMIEQTLKVGDIVNFGPNRDYYSQIVSNSKQWINGIQQSSDNLYISLDVTRHLSDAVKFFAKQIKDQAIDYIELPKTDATIKKIFTTSSKTFDINQADFIYMPNEKKLSIYYQNKTLMKTISAPFTLKKIEKEFASKDANTNDFAKISAHVTLFIDGKEHEFPIETSPATLKKLFGTKVKVESGLSKSKRITGTFDIEKVKEKINKISL